MNTQRHDRQNEIAEKLIAYHLGLLSEQEKAELESRICAENELSELSEKIKASLLPLEYYQVDVPVELYDKIVMQVHRDELTTEQIIADISKEGVSNRKYVFRRISDFVAMAASIALIVSAILLSVSHVRHQARRAICAGNLGVVGTGLACYANDFANQLPFARVSANRWYDKDVHRAYRPHLFLLVKNHYLDPKFLVCPEDSRGYGILLTGKDLNNYNDFPKGSVVSYSFQNLFGDSKFSPRERYLRWERARQLAVMADRTPLLSSGIGGKLRLPNNITEMLSPNHIFERGQNILSLEGNVVWQDSPLFGVNRDNIWQAGDIKEYRGTETPVSATDVFLAP